MEAFLGWYTGMWGLVWNHLIFAFNYFCFVAINGVAILLVCGIGAFLKALSGR